MKRRLLGAMLSVIVLTMAAMVASVEAAKLADQDADVAQMKADEQRVKNFAMVISSTKETKSIIIGNFVSAKARAHKVLAFCFFNIRLWRKEKIILMVNYTFIKFLSLRR
ncbi:hypothetical protein SCACP_22430 [Sporomusa carbonis]|uniref:hypothetical protein n=1 Tax=Sporomusa carbonis TaxID=3076075 RepID=UPI003A6A19D4